MALQKAQLSFTVLDAQGVSSAMPNYVEMDSAETIANVITAVQGYGTDLDAGIDGQITAVEFKLIIPILGAWKAAPVDPGANVGDTALFNFAIAGLEKRSFSFDVPSWARSQVAAGKIILGAGTPAQQLISDWSGGIAAMNFFTEVWQGLGSFRKCKLTTRKHRKPESVASSEE